MPVAIDSKYVNEVFSRLSLSPTSQDLDFLLEAYTKIGYYVAVSIGDADLEEAQLDYDEAEAKRDMKQRSEKATAAIIDAHAVIATFDQRKRSIKARTDARKMMNLYQSVEQAINAIKYLGRMDSNVRIGA
jgi:hypothetical protein